MHFLTHISVMIPFSINQIYCPQEVEVVIAICTLKKKKHQETNYFLKLSTQVCVALYANERDKIRICPLLAVIDGHVMNYAFL